MTKQELASNLHRYVTVLGVVCKFKYESMNVCIPEDSIIAPPESTPEITKEYVHTLNSFLKSHDVLIDFLIGLIQMSCNELFEQNSEIGYNKYDEIISQSIDMVCSLTGIVLSPCGDFLINIEPDDDVLQHINVFDNMGVFSDFTHAFMSSLYMIKVASIFAYLNSQSNYAMGWCLMAYSVLEKGSKLKCEFDTQAIFYTFFSSTYEILNAILDSDEFEFLKKSLDFDNNIDAPVVKMYIDYITAQHDLITYFMGGLLAKKTPIFGDEIPNELGEDLRNELLTATSDFFSKNYKFVNKYCSYLDVLSKIIVEIMSGNKE